MTRDAIIDETVKYVKQELIWMEAGHDWYHIERVWKNAKAIQKHEKKANGLVVSLWALLHDIADAKFHGGDETIWPKKTRSFLETLGVEKNNIDAVVDIVENISFKKEFEKWPHPTSPSKGEEKDTPLIKGDKGGFKKSLELQIVQDADRIDALGAIGIARTFSYGWHKWVPFYDEDIKPRKNISREEYLNGTSTTINHFYEKLFLLKDMMNTKHGKKIAKKRHKFMLAFVKEFKAEFKGKK
jgi:uncharacterized protein